MAHGSLDKVVQHIRRLVGLSGEVTDRELLGRFAASRDESAFVALVERHGTLVLGACRRLLTNEQDAEDVFQATFLLLARKANAVHWRESIGNWLYEAAYRMASRKRVQAARRHKHERQAAIMFSSSPASPPDWSDLRGVIDEELQRLPEKYRMPLLLCCLHGQSRDEAAEQLGWSTGAVKGRLERGRELLRQRLRRRGLSLSVALLTGLLGQESVAAVPAALSASVRQAVATGTMAAPVADLLKGELQAMFWSRMKMAAVVFAVVAGLGTGVGIMRPHAAADVKDTPDTKTEASVKEPEPAWGVERDGLRIGLAPLRLVIGKDAKDITVTVWYENVGKEEREIPVHVSPNLDHLVFKGVKDGKAFTVSFDEVRKATPPPEYAGLARGKKQHDDFTLPFGGHEQNQWSGLPELRPGESLTLQATDRPGRNAEPLSSGTITVTRAGEAAVTTRLLRAFDGGPKDAGEEVLRSAKEWEDYIKTCRSADVRDQLAKAKIDFDKEMVIAIAVGSWDSSLNQSEQEEMGITRVSADDGKLLVRYTVVTSDERGDAHFPLFVVKVSRGDKPVTFKKERVSHGG